MFLPLPHLHTWVLHDRDTTELRSRMGGAFGLSSRLGQWSDTDRQLFRHAVDEYKRLRPFLGGQRFLLTGPLHQDWEVWQIVSPSGQDFVVLAFREAGHVAEIRVSLRAVLPDRSYLVQRSGVDPAVSTTGAELAANGITIHFSENRQSDIIWVTMKR